MRIIVLADSHGAGGAVMKIVERNIYTADLFIHLGDGADDTWGVLQEYPEIKLAVLRGNCDRGNELPDSRVIETVMGPGDKIVKIAAVHGHLHNADHGTGELLKFAKENDCSIMLFAHTHCRHDEQEDGVLILNPGSCSLPRDGNPPSYVYIDITEWGIISGIVDLVE